MERFTTTIGVINTDFISGLNTFLQIQKNFFERNKLLNESDSIDLLHVQYNTIENEIRRTIDRFQTNEYSITFKDIAKTACKEMRALSMEIEQILISKNTNFHAHQHELKAAFNFSVSKQKKLLPNYVDIEKEFLNHIIQNNAFESKKPIKKVEDNDWFKVGLNLADGTIYKLINIGNSATNVAKQLGNQTGYRPYISESIGVKCNEKPKSIYSSISKMQTIYNHCTKNNIVMCEKFLSKLKELNVI